MVTESYRPCPGCGGDNPPSLRFCRTCGCDLGGQDLDTETLQIDLPPVKPGEMTWPQRIGRFLFLFFLVVGFLIWLTMPRFRSPRPQAREKACYANMRVILGAVEMYNMDHTTMLTSVSDEMVRQPGGLLVKEQYLKGTISSPETGCSYGTAGDLTISPERGGGRITCAIHGGVE